MEFAEARRLAKDAPLGPLHTLDNRQIIEPPVYFCCRSRLYEIFDEVVQVLPYFDPSSEQRYYCVEILIMNGGLNHVKVFFI